MVGEVKALLTMTCDHHSLGKYQEPVTSLISGHTHITRKWVVLKSSTYEYFQKHNNTDLSTYTHTCTCSMFNAHDSRLEQTPPALKLLKNAV